MEIDPIPCPLARAMPGTVVSFEVQTRHLRARLLDLVLDPQDGLHLASLDVGCRIVFANANLEPRNLRHLLEILPVRVERGERVEARLEIEGYSGPVNATFVFRPENPDEEVPPCVR